MICGDMNFENTGTEKQKNKKEVSKSLWVPHKISTFNNKRVTFVASGVCSAHNIIITDTGETWTLGETSLMLHWFWCL